LTALIPAVNDRSAEAKPKHTMRFVGEALFIAQAPLMPAWRSSTASAIEST
jgi:hypothetical protein